MPSGNRNLCQHSHSSGCTLSRCCQLQALVRRLHLSAGLARCATLSIISLAQSLAMESYHNVP